MKDTPILVIIASMLFYNYFIYIVGFVLSVAGSIYIYIDSKKRNFASPILWAVFLFFFNTLTIIVYLLNIYNMKTKYIDKTSQNNQNNNNYDSFNSFNESFNEYENTNQSAIPLQNNYPIFLICILAFRIIFFIL